MKKIVIILAILFFGVLLFSGGFFYSNYLIKKNQSIGEARKAKYEKEFLEISNLMLTNSYLSMLVTEGTSSVWSNAIKYEYKDFNTEIRKSLNEIENSLGELEKTDNEITIGMQRLKDYPIQYQEAYNTLMELHGVYSQLYSLAQSPSGSLMSFNNKVNDLTSEFTKIMSKLKIYMPRLADKKPSN